MPVGNLDDLLAAAAKADGSNRIEYRDPIAAFDSEAIRRLEPWIGDARLAAFAVLAIKRAGELGALAEAGEALRRAAPKAQGRTADDVRLALEALGLPTKGARTAKPRAPRSGSQDKALNELRVLVARWRAAGSPSQPGVSWRRPSWIRTFPRHKSTFEKLPDLLDRKATRAVALDAAADVRAAEAAFLVSRAWGEGMNGYGATRALDIFDLNPEVSGALLNVSRVLRDAGPAAAYEAMSNAAKSRLKKLGPAFGTKYLYFSQPEGQRPRALIHDAQIAKWFRARAGTSLGSEEWSPPIYMEYLRTMHDWARELDCEPDDLEMCIFRSMAPPGSQWAW
jgi:hypothetical protein